MARDGEGGRRVQRGTDVGAIDAKLRRARREFRLARDARAKSPTASTLEAEGLAKLEIDSLLEDRVKVTGVTAVVD